jgi:integrase
VPRAAADEAPAVPTLGKFIDEYARKRTDLKASTKTAWGHTKRCLVEFFGATRPLDRITAGEAEDFRRWLADDQKLAENTVRRRISFAKQFFAAAVRYEYLGKSPFVEIKGCLVRENRDRDHYVTREEAFKVLDACPSIGWRLVFALSRFGGLRCPSEVLKLRWQDVNWEQDRFTIHSPKTEHHEGKATRLAPIFPELRPILEEAWEQAEDGTEFVVTSPRGDNLATGMERIIRSAGVEPWAKLFQNCRSTRATELVSAGWPEYKVCKWLGHTEKIARRHYWQVTDDDYRKAAGLPDGNQQKSLDSGPTGGAGGFAALQEALQKALQVCREEPCKAVQHSPAAESDPVGVTPEIARGCSEFHGVSACVAADSAGVSMGKA